MSIHARHRPIIDLQGLTKSYKMGHGVVPVLHGVNLQVYSGNSLAIMGPSGSGKSTLLHLLGCLDSPTEGHYYLDGDDVSSLGDGELASIRASKIGFVFQSFNLIPQLTVLENVELPLLYQARARAEGLREKIEHSLERVGLSHRVHHHPTELSGGEMQRVAIARALVTDPLIILADEPTGNLDSETGKTILALFTRLHEEGATLIIVTHDASVAAHCARLIRMQDGKIASEEGSAWSG